MHRMKYIMVLDELGNETPILFPNNLIHQEVAHGVRRACKCIDVISAGFVTIKEVDTVQRMDGKVKYEFVAFSESESLGIKSSKDDSEIINIKFNGNKL